MKKKETNETDDNVSAVILLKIKIMKIIATTVM